MSDRSNRLTVLIGDDDVAVRSSVEDLLGDRGFRLLTAGDGREALQLLFGELIDFSILDVEMPGLSGPEVIHAFLQGPFIAGDSGPAQRAAPPREMPVIFMSGNHSEEVRSTCEELGSTFLDKPFAPNDMREAVDRVLAGFPH
ncbi:MAG: hypothetical protein DHS20C15_34280 [Planctomycetota bacterium]|nr:MAG: hypothetical protein DHS20C15_34280 [Planctomycetota bacterium]